jgi:hypothetical protein
MSTSPDWSAVKRCWALRGTQRTLLASPSTAAAMARQTSTSSPRHCPWLSAAAKPITPVLTPQASWPRT